MTALQLSFDGHEVEHPAPPGRAPLSPAQAAVMRHLGLHGNIRSIDAGRILHAVRAEQHLLREGVTPLHPTVQRERGLGTAGCGVTGERGNKPYHGSGCCAFASTDGSGVMRRLAERGLVVKLPRLGLWITATTEVSRRWSA